MRRQANPDCRRPASLIALSALVLAGCTMTRQEPSGFLPDYHGLEDSPHKNGMMERVRSEKALRRYRRILVEPVTARRHPDAKMTRVDEEETAMVCARFTDQLVEEFGEGYTIVKEPSADTLRVRAVLTDARGAIPLMNLHYSTILIGAGLGGASMEAAFIDSQSGKVLAAFMDSKIGNRLNVLGGWTEFGHIKGLTRAWAAFLKKRLDIAQGKVSSASGGARHRGGPDSDNFHRGGQGTGFFSVSFVSSC